MAQLSNDQFQALWDAQSRNENGWCRGRLPHPTSADDELSVESFEAANGSERELKFHYQWVAPYSDADNTPTSSVERFVSIRASSSAPWSDWRAAPTV